MRISVCVPVAPLVFVGALGCQSAGPSKTVTRSLDLDNAKQVSVELKMTAGELHVSGGATKLLDAAFTFNVPEWEPQIHYDNDGSAARLAIRQPSGSTSFRNTENKWNLRFNDTVPVSLTTSLTAGEATLTLGAMNLGGVQIDAGAGEFTLDLRGAPKRSYDVRINAGVGEAHIKVPRTVAVVATATTGIGEVSVSGLQKQSGNTWINPGHEQDPVTIHLQIHGGVGEIHVDAE